MFLHDARQLHAVVSIANALKTPVGIPDRGIESESLNEAVDKPAFMVGRFDLARETREWLGESRKQLESVHMPPLLTKVTKCSCSKQLPMLSKRCPSFSATSTPAGALCFKSHLVSRQHIHIPSYAL